MHFEFFLPYCDFLFASLYTKSLLQRANRTFLLPVDLFISERRYSNFD